MPECTGVKVKLHRNVFFNKGALNVRHRLHVSKRGTCGCECCQEVVALLEARGAELLGEINLLQLEAKKTYCLTIVDGRIVLSE